MAVSSRGQDTWFSATGPGFDSPYRYHTSRRHDPVQQPVELHAALQTPRKLPISVATMIIVSMVSTDSIVLSRLWAPRLTVPSADILAGQAVYLAPMTVDDNLLPTTTVAIRLTDFNQRRRAGSSAS